MDERGTVPAQEGMIVITKAKAESYKNAMKNNDKVYADSIRNNIAFDKEGRPVFLADSLWSLKTNQDNFPELSFHLFEKSPKKQQFLKKCQQRFGNIQVFGEIPSKLPGIDLVTSRAFKPLDVIFEISREYCLSGGRYFLLKGRKEKIQEELELAQKKFKGLQVEVLPLSSPVLEVERHLVLR
jgi:hypothetical protein